jgi:hypothetical protein
VNVALAQALVDLAGIYFGVGLLFAIAFATFAAGRIDPAAAAGSLGFRILILPGAALLWPLLAPRCLAGRSIPPEERDAHTDLARAGVRG